MNVRKLLLCLPFICLTGFVVFYLLAAQYYPGGHRHDPGFEGHSWLHNYYSDLLQPTTLDGKINHGRPFALASLALLELTFLSFWVNLANFWLFGKRFRIAGNVLGSAMVFSSSLLVHYHEAALKLTMLLGMAGFSCLVTVLILNRQRFSLLLTVAFFVATSANFVLWALQYMEPKLPMLQKLVFLMFAVWVVVLTAEVVRYNRRDIDAGK